MIYPTKPEMKALGWVKKKQEPRETSCSPNASSSFSCNNFIRQSKLQDIVIQGYCVNESPVSLFSWNFVKNDIIQLLPMNSRRIVLEMSWQSSHSYQQIELEGVVIISRSPFDSFMSNIIDCQPQSQSGVSVNTKEKKVKLGRKSKTSSRGSLHVITRSVEGRTTLIFSQSKVELHTSLDSLISFCLDRTNKILSQFHFLRRGMIDSL